MRSLFTILLFGLLISPAFTQPEPITITFVEAQPKWEHLTVDTSFYEIGIQPDVNKYTVVTPHKCFRFQDDLILLHYCTNYKGSIYGYILEKINAYSGETEWQDYSTYYNGGVQDFYKTVDIRPDGKLEMQGVKRLGPYVDSIFFYWNFGGTSNFIRKVFDYQSGKLEQIIESQDSIVGSVARNLNFYTIKSDSLYVLSRITLDEENDTYKFGHSFFPLDANGNYTTQQPISHVEYETTDSIGPLSYGQPQFIKQIDDTSWVCLLFKERIHHEIATAQLIWFTMGSDFEIKVTRRMQIENLIPGEEESFLYLTFDVANGLTYISQPYFNESLHANATFLLCFDQNGNLVHNLQNCNSDGYRYEFISRIYSSTLFDYLAAFPSRTGRQGFDILKLNRHEDQFQYISSLTSAYDDEQFTRQMEVCRMYDDGLFVIGAYTKKLGAVQNSAVKYYGFDGKDLGMSIPTAVGPSPKAKPLAIFPNPANDELNISFEGVMKEIRLFSIDGRRVVVNTQISGKKLDNSSLPKGFYFIDILTDQQWISGSFSKM